MRKYIKITALILVVIFCTSGCKGLKTSVLDTGLSNYIGDRTESQYDPNTFSEQLEVLLAQYTGGLLEYNKNPDDIDKDIPSDDEEQIIDDSDDLDIADTKNEVIEIIRTACEKTEKVVTIKTQNLSLDIDDFITFIYDDISNSEMIDFMGTRSFSVTDIPDPADQSTVIYRVEFDYLMSINQIKKMKTEAKKEVKNVVRKLNLNGLTDYQKVVKIRQYLMDTVTYPEKEPYKEPTYTAYGALIDGSAVCDGYARATQALFEECGVEGRYIWGPVVDNGGLHAWNMVELDNEWYQMDITWDDAVSSDTYFLVTDSFMKESRSWEESRWPKSSTTPYNKAA